MNNEGKELISVLMAVFNEKENFLKRAIDSILFQTYANFEFLIIDDGSTKEKCCKILREYAKKDSRVVLIENKNNLGLTKSLNKGFNLAKGKYIARIDSDDIADIRRLEKQLDFLRRNPSCVLCGSWSYIIDEDTNIIGEKKFFTDYEKIRKNLLFFNFFTHSSLFFRKDITINTGGYNEKIKKAQDYDFILKISAKNSIANVSKFLCFHRINSESISSKGKKKQEWCAIKARWHAVWSYGYPKVYIFKVIPSILYFLFIPHFIEKQIFKFFWK